jgi:hypothetical protein
MNKRNKVSRNCLVAGIALLCLTQLYFITATQAGYTTNFYPLLTDHSDTTTPVKQQVRKRIDTGKSAIYNDTIITKDSSQSVQKNDTFNVKMSKDSLDGPVTYEAEDSGVLIIPTRQFILYGKATTSYLDLKLTAALVKMDQQSNRITAYGNTDSTNSPYDKPKLDQGGMTSISDTIFYDIKTQKGLTKSTYYQEGDMFVYAQKLKKVDKDVFYAASGRFTTCNLDTPHFAFRTRKMKLVNNKIAVTGPANPEFEGVPVPIGIPFGIFPLNRGRQSGLLPPQFASNEDFGLGLEGLGYYKVLSDNLDITVRTNIYSYGGWNVNLSNRYLKRYKYSGGFTLAIQKTKILDRFGKGTDEFIRNSSFQIGWNHNRDAKARPGSTFNASVNAGSTQFNRFTPNNAVLNFQNQLSSSINYTKDWRGKYNLSVSANHNQNNTSRLVNLNLPTVNFNVVTLYPFEPKDKIGEGKWYEKIGIGYSGNLQNQLSFYDSAFNIRRVLDTMQWGANHSIPITLSLPQFGPIQVAPGISYEEKWYGQKIERNWDTASKSILTNVSRGFFTARQVSFSLGANTRIFGTYDRFKKSSRLKAIRHEIRPNVSLNYKPDLMKRFYKSVQIDTTGKNFVRFSQFEGGIGGSFGEGTFGGVGFGIDNVLEMKVKDKNDTAVSATKKIKLIDGFGFSSAYNMVADSFKLQPFSFYLRSTLFDKINITASTILDPYEVDSRGFRRDKLLWAADKFSLGRITNGSISASTQFQSKSKDGKTDDERIPQDEFMTPDEQQRQLEFVRQNPAEYTDFNIPWSLQLSYSLNFSRLPKADYSGFRTEIFSNVSINGDFSLSPKWKVGAQSYYDFKTAQIQTLTMFVSREMHCWQMSINITPVGLYRSFNITVNPKSGILRDLRINRSRFFYNQ